MSCAFSLHIMEKSIASQQMLALPYHSLLPYHSNYFKLLGIVKVLGTGISSNSHASYQGHIDCSILQRESTGRRVGSKKWNSRTVSTAINKVQKEPGSSRARCRCNADQRRTATRAAVGLETKVTEMRQRQKLGLATDHCPNQGKKAGTSPLVEKLVRHC
jgi:hypothetical protein